ncbi:response regulator [Chloroflexota bacterium]
MKKTRLIVVEDEALFRELLTSNLSNEPGLEVIAEAEDGEAAIRLARELQPDVMLMDIELKGDIDGIEAALQIKKERDQTGIVILSSHKDRRYINSVPLDSSTGWAYLLKQTVSDITTIVRAIEASKDGMLMLDPAIARDLVPKENSAVACMSKRKREVLGLIAQGYNNAAIAGEMSLSGKSIETYINVIYQELGLSGEPNIHNRVKATLLFLRDSRNWK